MASGFNTSHFGWAQLGSTGPQKEEEEELPAMSRLAKWGAASATTDALSPPPSPPLRSAPGPPPRQQPPGFSSALGEGSFKNIYDALPATRELAPAPAPDPSPHPHPPPGGQQS